MIFRLFNELQYRRVFRTLGGYAFVAWIVVEAADVIFPALGVPESMLTGLIVLALAGFPVVAVLTWIFDVTPEGIVVGTASPQSAAGLSRLSQVSSWLLVVVLGVAVVYLSNRLYLQSDGGPTFTRGKSVAVLPFKNIAADDQSNAAYFSDGIAEGIINAVQEVGVNVPVVVRLEGTNVEKGRQMLADSGLDLLPAKDLNDAAQKVVAAASSAGGAVQ